MPNNENVKSGTVEEVFSGFLTSILHAAHTAADQMTTLKAPPEVSGVPDEVEVPVPDVPEVTDPAPIPDTLDEAIEAKIAAEQAQNEVPIENVPIPSEEEDEDDDLFDMDDDDMANAETEEFGDPELDHLRAANVLDYEDQQFAEVAKPVTMYAVDSSHMLAIGRIIKQKDPKFCTMYVVFKGDNPYRYGPVTLKAFEEILGEGVRKADGRVECSVGSVFHNLVKSEADSGTIKCQRLDKANKRWVEVPPKAERVKTVKAKHGK